MQVQKERHIDAPGPDEPDDADYYYEYDTYTFSDSELTLFARSYTDMAAEAHFLSKVWRGKPGYLSARDFRHPLAQQAVAYLLAEEGKTHLTFLAAGRKGYLAVPGCGGTEQH